MIDAAGRTYVDSASPESPDFAQYELGNAAVVGTGFFRGWHVTDNPAAVRRFLSARRIDLAAEHENRELGPGFYVSAVPDYWKGRSTRRWDALRALTSAQVVRIASEVSADSKLTRPGYLTENERTRALRIVQNWVDGDEFAIIDLAQQPYNVNVLDTMRRLGIQTYEPSEVEVTFVGRYVTLGRRLQQNEWRRLRAEGWDGAFTKGGMGSNPELAIWDGARIESSR